MAASGTQLADAYVQIIPSMQGTQRALSEELTRSGTSAGDAAGKAIGGRTKGGILAGALAAGAGFLGAFGLAEVATRLAGGVKDALVDSVAYASDLNEAGTAVTAVFGTATDKINDFAAAGAKGLGQNRLDVLNAAKTFGVYGKAAGLGAQANADFSTKLVGLSTDLASFYNVDPSQAAEAIAAGLRGESEPLRQYGVLLDDATLKAEAMRQGTYNGTGTLSQQAKVLAAQAVILKQTTVAQGDFARTSGGLANQQRILSAQVDTLKGNLGSVLLPVVNLAVKGLNGLLGPVLDLTSKFPGLGDSIGKGLGNVPALLAPLGQALAPLGATIAAAFTPLGPVLADLGKSFLAVAPNLSVVSLAFRALQPVLPTLLGIIGQLATLLGGTLSTVLSTLAPVLSSLAGTFVGIAQTVLASVLPVVGQLVTMLGSTLATVLPMLLPIITQVAGVLGGALGAQLGYVATVIGSLVSSVLPVFLSALQPIIATVLQFIPPIVQLASSLISMLAPILTRLVSAVFPVLATVISTVVRAIAPLIGAVLSLVAPLLGALLPVLIRLVQAVLPPVVAVLGRVVSAVIPVVQILGTVLTEVIKALLPVISTVFKAIVPIIEGALNIVVGIINVVTGIITGNWKQVFGGLGQIVRGAFQAVVGVITGAVSIVGAAIGAVVKIIGSVLKGAISLVVSIGGNIIDGLVSGLRDAGQRVFSFFSGFIGNVVEFAKKLLGIASPSKVFKALGRFTVDGFAVGFQGGSDQVLGAVSDLRNKIVDAFDNLATQREASQKRVKKLDQQLGDVSGTKAAAVKRRAVLEAALKDERATLAGLNAAKSVGKSATLKALDADTKGLEALTKRRDTLRDRLKSQQDDLDAVIKTRDDFGASIREASVSLGNVADAYSAVVSRRDDASKALLGFQDDLVSLSAEQADSAKDLADTQAEGAAKVAAIQAKAAAFNLQNATSAVAFQDLSAERQQSILDKQAEFVQSINDTQAEYASKVLDLQTKATDQVAKRADLEAQVAAATAAANERAVPSILSNLQAAIDRTNSFNTTLSQLKGQGLDDTTYQQLLGKGIANGGLDAANELLAAGPDAVHQVGVLQGQLDAAGKALGTATSTVLYQAGVDSAQGLVDGTKAKIVDNQAAISLLEAAMAVSVGRLGVNTKSLMTAAGGDIVAGLNDGIRGKGSDLDKTITSLGTSAVKALKKRLGIKSPSRVLDREVGVQMGAGVIRGVERMKAATHAAIEGLVTVPSVADPLATSALAAPTLVQQNFNGPMGLTADQVADGIATKARRAITGTAIPTVRVG